MPLITCIDCKKSISDRIENCPHCSCPVSLSKEAAEAAILKEKEEIAESRKKRKIKRTSGDGPAYRLRELLYS